LISMCYVQANKPLKMTHFFSLMPSFFRSDNKKVVKKFRETTEHKVNNSHIFFRELITEKVIYWAEEIGWHKNGEYLALGDKTFSEGGKKISTMKLYRKEAALLYDEVIQKAVCEVEYHTFSQDPEWCKDVEASYTKDNGLAYHEEEEGFQGMKGCFMMLASDELHEFRRASSTKTADGTGNVIRV
jgi:hypothetical protein